MYKGALPSLGNIGDDSPGQMVVLLGTAARGPVMEPVCVAGPEHAAQVFGSEGSLPGGYRLAHAVNPQASYCLMRINGTRASLSVNIPGDDGDSCLFALQAMEAGGWYNNVAARVDAAVPGEEALVITDGNVRNVYRLAEFPMLGELVDKINLDASLGYSPVTASTTEVTVPSSSLVPLFQDWSNLSGGDDGLMPTKNELYAMLAEAYSRLEGLRADIVVPLGVYFDDVLVSYTYSAPASLYDSAWYTDDPDRLTLREDDRRATFHGQLIDFCRRQFARGLMCHGVLGLRPMPEAGLIAQSGLDYVAGLIKISCLATREGFVIGQDDMGHHISLVLGDLEYDGGYYSGAAAYAALMASAGTETTTGMAVNNIKSQRTYLDGDAMRYAADNGLVTFYNSLKKGLAVYSGVTAAPSGRPLHYIANVRTAQYLIQILRMALDPYLGTMQGIIPIRDAVERATKSVLEDARQSGLIQSYAFDLQLRWLDAFSVACDINLSFRAKYAVEDISVTTTITTPA